MKHSNFNTSDYHLPYNSVLVSRAKELRKNMTSAEKKLWNNYLKNFPFRVLRQRPIDNFIVDFYCFALKLVIEIDGDSHFTEQGIIYDEERTLILENYGLKVVRFTNTQISHEFEGVCEEINGLIPPNPPSEGGKINGLIPPNPPSKGGKINELIPSKSP